MGCRLTVTALGPEHLGVAGEPLVQPDVLPALQRDAVAEPLVGQLMGDFRFPEGGAVVGDQLLRLQRGVEGGVLQHRAAEGGERVGAEPLREVGQHLGHPGEGAPLLASEVMRERLAQRGAGRTRALRHLQLGGVESDQIAGGGVAVLPSERAR